MTSPRGFPARRLLTTVIAAALVGGAASVLIAAPSQAAPASTGFNWATVANNGDQAPGSDKQFNSYSQPSVNRDGVIAFRGRTQGNGQPARGIYLRDTGTPGSPITAIASVGDEVPQPNNSGGTFNEFPSFPRIDADGTIVVSRGQSTPVWTYQLDGTDTKVGTSGIYASVDGTLSTGASLLGAVPGFEGDAVPDAPAGTRFDQFPGSPAVDGSIIAFKGNYTDNGVGKTGVYVRNLNPVGGIALIANSNTRIPNQPADGTTLFGSTAPPSAAAGHVVFTGWDDESLPTMGGIYLADATAAPALQTLVGIGDQVPGESPGTAFANFGEGLSFDGRYLGFWASWGTETTSITLTCPTDGNADLLAYCAQTYPDGYTTSVPTHQGIFVYDTTTDSTYPISTTGTRFSGFQYWVFSGKPPGTGGGDEEVEEPARWRSSPFVSVSSDDQNGFQVAFKASPVAGGSGIYLAQGPNPQQDFVAAVETGMSGLSIDDQSPVGALVTTVGLERESFRGRWLAITVSMLDPATSEGWAGIYLAKIPQQMTAQTTTFTSTPPVNATVAGSYDVSATSDSGLPVSFSIDASTTNSACSISGVTVSFDHAGTCVVNAEQPGDVTHLAAPRVQQSFAIAVIPVTLSITTSASSSVYGQAVHAVASVTAGAGTATGTVQFAVDATPLGAPVGLNGGTALSPDLVAGGSPLAVGSHQVSATFTPLDPSVFAAAGATVTQVVNPAATTMDLRVGRATVIATVTPSAPSGGTPTGTVWFSLGGASIGGAFLIDGTATLAYVVPPGKTQQVAAVYSGDTRFTASSGSTARSDPGIRAIVTSKSAKTRYGWYRSAVTVSFTCVTNGAPLVGGCPSRVVLTRSGGGQSVSRTIVATNGGAATLVVGNINIDRTRPRVTVAGVRNAAVYFGTAPRVRCMARDTYSGVASCRLTRRTSGDRTTYRATATDRAGNTSTATGSYRTLHIYVQGARYVNGTFQVKVGRTYTLVAYATTRPVFYAAQTYPGRPFVRGQAMRQAGHHRWALGVTITSGLRRHRYWNLGVRIGTTMHVVRIHAT